MLTLSESIGLGARAIRLEAGLTLEAVATAAKPFGLAWSTGKVSDFESGRIAPTLPTFIAAAATLGAATGRQLSLADLVGGEGRVRINDKMSPEVAQLRAALSGKRAALSGKDVTAGTSLALTFKATATAIVTPRGVDPELHIRVLNDFRESDTRMCKNIGVDPEVGSAAMAKLWQRTFSAERDHQAGPDANAQRKGQISRQLKAELQEVINDGNN